MAGRRWIPGLCAVLVTVLGCSDLGTTATGPQGFEVPGPQPRTPVRYVIVLLDADTTFDQGNFILYQRARLQRENGLAVVAAEVDFAATVGRVDPTRMPMREDRTVAVTWTIPPDVTVGNLTGCARPPGQPCNMGPLLKWNR